jgi:adenine-specific DNA-methyltransferase
LSPDTRHRTLTGVIKYIGSKRTLVPLIVETITGMPGVRTVLDLFSGTSRVGHALKRAGLRVLANDHNAYAATLARCYVQADSEELAEPARKLIAEFSALPPSPGYITETFCRRSRFFQPHNGERIDAIRDAIARKCLDPELEAVLLVSLMEAADRVDSTTGVQMAYLKRWAPRAAKSLELRLPDLLPRSPFGKGHASALDALDAAASLPADLAYIDPPYNQHSYLGNYHIWESLVRWDKSPVYGVACKRLDCRDRRSVFNSRPRFAAALRAVLAAVRCPRVLVSFSNEGFLTRAQLESMLAEVFPDHTIAVAEQDYKRYVGAQIGIYNPAGRKVGKVSHLRNTEYLYIVTPTLQSPRCTPPQSPTIARSTSAS